MVTDHSQEELDAAYLSLTKEQREILDEKVKRGMKTKWLNLWCKKKGEVLTKEELDNPDKTMESMLDWTLLNYEVNLSGNPDIRCECGRQLKYRYTVLHKETGRIYKLGIIHFKEHTGLEPEMVRLVVKGLKEIDLERDEILSKVIDNWELPLNIPAGVEIPDDISEQLRVKLPLLDRQIKQLEKIISKYFIKEKRYIQNKVTPKKVNKNKRKEEFNECISIFDMLLQQYLSKEQFLFLYNKLKLSVITAGEAREIYQFVKSYPAELHGYGLNIEDIKKASIKALGKIGDREIRKWLVEIEYLVI